DPKLLASLTERDSAAAEALLRDGKALISGRTKDADGRSVFWHAISHELPGPAL
ncbi:unnamed protein product, partial [Polarella glacialis]